MWSVSWSAHPRHRPHPAQGSGLESLPWQPAHPSQGSRQALWSSGLRVGWCQRTASAGERDAGGADVAGRGRPRDVGRDPDQRSADRQLAGADDLPDRRVKPNRVPQRCRRAVDAAASGDVDGSWGGSRECHVSHRRHDAAGGHRLDPLSPPFGGGGIACHMGARGRREERTALRLSGTLAEPRVRALLEDRFDRPDPVAVEHDNRRRIGLRRDWRLCNAPGRRMAELYRNRRHGRASNAPNLMVPSVRVRLQPD